MRGEQSAKAKVKEIVALFQPIDGAEELGPRVGPRGRSTIQEVDIGKRGRETSNELTTTSLRARKRLLKKGGRDIELASNKRELRMMSQMSHGERKKKHPISCVGRACICRPICVRRLASTVDRHAAGHGVIELLLDQNHGIDTYSIRFNVPGVNRA